MINLSELDYLCFSTSVRLFLQIVANILFFFFFYLGSWNNETKSCFCFIVIFSSCMFWKKIIKRKIYKNSNIFYLSPWTRICEWNMLRSFLFFLFVAFLNEILLHNIKRKMRSRLIIQSILFKSNNFRNYEWIFIKKYYAKIKQLHNSM